MAKQRPSVADFIANGKSSGGAGTRIEFAEFHSGSGVGGGVWEKTGVIGQVPNQSPEQLSNIKFNDSNGDEWTLVHNGVFINAESIGALNDGATDNKNIFDAARSNGLVLVPYGVQYVDSGNGEFYLYDTPSSRKGVGEISIKEGSTLSLSQNPNPVVGLEKTMDGNAKLGSSNFDGGVVYAQLNKKGGDNFGCAGSFYTRSDGGTGDAIGLHARALGSSPGESEVFGLWSYVVADPSDNTRIKEYIGQEIDVNNRGLDDVFTELPSEAVGGGRGLIIVTADGSNAVNIGLDIGRQDSSKGFYTGARLRQDGVEPTDAAGVDTCQMRIQGSSLVSESYGGINMRQGNFKYGIDSRGSSISNDAFLVLDDSHRVYFGDPTLGSGSAQYISNTSNSINFQNMLLEINGTQVVGTRKTGWSDPTGAASQATFDTATVTTEQLAQRFLALYTQLKQHGLIGN